MDVGVLDQRFSLSGYWQGKSLVSRVYDEFVDITVYFYQNGTIGTKYIKWFCREPSPLKVSPKTKINYFYTILCISMRIAVK